MADRFQVLFLESFWQLGGLLSAGTVILFFAWKQVQTPGRFRVLIGWVVAAGVLLTVQKLVRTDREQVVSTLHVLANAVNEGDLDTFAEPISEMLIAPGSDDKQDFIDKVRRTLERNTVDEVQLDKIEVVVTGDVAAVTFRARARVETEQMVWPMTISHWKLRFEREADEQWRVIRIESQQVGLGI